jgi:dihydrolipoamide dehydrogenase
MSEQSFDCVVIGAGPGGYVAAIRAAQLGMRTAIIERDKVGGRCLNYACIPAKAVLRSADILEQVRTAGEYGVSAQSVSVDYAAVQARRERVVGTLTAGVAGLMRKNKIEVIAGAATLIPGSPARVRTGEVELAAKTIVLATGSVGLTIPGVQLGGRVIGTEQAWALPELPGRLAVVGAGASGAEIASAFARLGSEVLLFEVLSRVLPSEDEDISRLAERAFKGQGIAVHTATALESVGSDQSGVEIVHGGVAERVDYLVIAAGRAPDIGALGLAEAGIALEENGRIRVDARMSTSLPGVYAIGDLVSGPALAHKASEEGIIAVESAAGATTHPIAHADIPRATFCAPNVASFGLTEAQAREAGYEVVIGKVPYGAVGAGTVYGDRSGLVKIVGERRYGELLGGHIIGTRATELIQELVNMRSLEGGYPELARIIHGHPTLSEAIMEAGRAADGWLIHG